MDVSMYLCIYVSMHVRVGLSIDGVDPRNIIFTFMLNLLPAKKVDCSLGSSSELN